MFELQKSHERVTRGESFNATEAKKAVDSYTHYLWKAIRKRLSKTDMTQSPCAFSEAPAEGIFSIMERVKQGRGSLSVKHLVQLSRLAAHGPPASTEAAMHLSKAALKNYKSQYGERFCTQFWVPGKTSKIVSELQSKKWDWWQQVNWIQIHSNLNKSTVMPFHFMLFLLSVVFPLTKMNISSA